MSTYVSLENAATFLKLSKQRVRELCRSKEITAEKIGNSWILNSSSLETFSLKNTHTSPQDHQNHQTSTKNKPIALSFFSGAMGLDLGLEKAGFQIRLTCEFDKYCRQTIELNRPETALLKDINDYSVKQILEYAQVNKKTDIDLIAGGPPCQAFSTAGNRKGFNDDRGNVFLKYLDIALEIRPKLIVIENVRGLLSCPMMHRPHKQRGSDFPDLKFDEINGGALYFITQRLKKSGYKYSFNLYNSANYGTPQVRERVIIICSRDGAKPPYIVPTHAENGEFGLPKWTTFEQATKGLTTHTSIKFPEKRLHYYRMLKPGQNWRNLPVKLQKEALGNSFYAGGGKTGFLRRLAWNKPSPTLVTHPAMPATDLAHPEEDRPLSIQEYKRIQEFPDDWKVAGPLIEQYRQIGNAVPISLGYALGKQLINLIKKKPITEIKDFQYSRYRNTNEIEWEEQFKNECLKKDAANQKFLRSKKG